MKNLMIVLLVLVETAKSASNNKNNFFPFQKPLYNSGRVFDEMMKQYIIHTINYGNNQFSNISPELKDLQHVGLLKWLQKKFGQELNDMTMQDVKEKLKKIDGKSAQWSLKLIERDKIDDLQKILSLKKFVEGQIKINL